MVSIEKLHQLIVRTLQILWDHLRFCDDGHEIIVAIPPRHHMVMQVSRDTGPGDTPEVDSDVVTIRIHGPSQTLDATPHTEHDRQQVIGL
jgi:hypothetical protein